MSTSFQLVMQTNPSPGKIIPLSKDEMVVGRDTTADITISDAEVSRRHARFYIANGACMLEDLGSTNGSFVNGQRISGPVALQSGDSVRFGENVTLTFEAPQPIFDANATMVAAGSSFPPPPMMSDSASDTVPPMEPAMMPPAAPSYSSQIPATPSFEPISPEPVSYTPSSSLPPVSSLEPPKKDNRTRNMILGGCGCLLLLVCVCAIGAYAFDALNLYSMVGL